MKAVKPGSLKEALAVMLVKTGLIPQLKKYHACRTCEMLAGSTRIRHFKKSTVA
jgi:hypothetical protein